MCFVAITIPSTSSQVDIRRAAVVFHRDAVSVVQDVRAGRPVTVVHDQDSDGHSAEQFERSLQRLDRFGLAVELHVSPHEPTGQDLQSGRYRSSAEAAVSILQRGASCGVRPR